MPKERRFGKFILSSEFVESGAARSVMAVCTIVRCEHNFVGDCFDYIAISPLFADLPIGHVIPDYRWIMREEGPLGVPALRAVRVQNCELYRPIETTEGSS